MRLTAVAAAFSAIACSRPIVTGSPATPDRGDAAATARLHLASGRPAGTVTFDPTDGGTRVVLFVEHLPPGVHGVHIHTVGKCEPDFAAAGGHFNPTMRQHGRDNASGPHAGDLPNIVVGTDSTGTATVVTSSIGLDGTSNGLFGAAGTAIVVHAGADDYKTDPAGNSGARIACGVVTRRTP
ncbi:MAG: superoxide dismutase family protein [Gemmatimonadaceae bacterium]